jgi:hypothetical protein
MGAMLLGGAIVEMVAIVATVVAAAGGHGNYVAAKILFPYSLALTRFTEVITMPLIVLALAQYPLYALALWSLRGSSLGQRRWAVLAAVHAAGIG